MILWDVILCVETYLLCCVMDRLISYVENVVEVDIFVARWEMENGDESKELCPDE